MLDEIKTLDNVPAFVQAVKDKKVSSIFKFECQSRCKCSIIPFVFIFGTTVRKYSLHTRE